MGALAGSRGVWGLGGVMGAGWVGGWVVITAQTKPAVADSAGYMGVEVWSGCVVRCEGGWVGGWPVGLVGGGG